MNLEYNNIFDAVTDDKSTALESSRKTGEKIFGSSYETPRNSNMNDPSHLNVGMDRHQAYRPMDIRRDEAVNTVDSTFRRFT